MLSFDLFSRCIPLPDVLAFDVFGGEYVRCVIASDGLWDVVSLSSITKVVNRHSSPELVARALVEKAFKKRESKRLRMDDITVQVIDVFGGHVQVSGNQGCVSNISLGSQVSSTAANSRQSSVDHARRPDDAAVQDASETSAEQPMAEVVEKKGSNEDCRIS